MTHLPARTLGAALVALGLLPTSDSTSSPADAVDRRSAPATLPAGVSPEEKPSRHQGPVLTWDVRDADTGEPIPCKLTFVGTDGTPNPAFTHNDIGRPEGDMVIAAYQRVFSAVGNEAIRLPRGTYDIYVSRGPEWDIDVRRGVRVDDDLTIKARLRHVVDTRGWLSADFHVHAAPSPDSIVPLSHRVLEFVADGIDMIVSADHNTITDYGQTIEQLGLTSLITSARGDELTTNGWGHFGAFPLQQDLERAGQGSLLVHGRNAKEIFANVRERAPEAIIDVHHPRLDPGVGYFLLGEFDPHSDRAGRPGFSFDFDAIEVLNGYQDPERKSVDRTIDDWLGLLNHGHLVTATGNSDTHHLTYNMGGYPRNYVRVADDRPGHVTPAEVAASVRAHHAFFTTGPFIRFRAGQGDIGDLVPAPGGKVTLAIEVDAAPWISVNRVILYVSGKEAARWPVPPGQGEGQGQGHGQGHGQDQGQDQGIVRFRASHSLVLAADGYAVVRVDGSKIMAPVVGDSRNFGVYPLALSNPIFFDVNGNGRYDPAEPHGAH